MEKTLNKSKLFVPFRKKRSSYIGEQLQQKVQRKVQLFSYNNHSLII